VFLALFGAISFGLLGVWSHLAPKLVDQFASDNSLFFVGLIVTAALVVLVLDLLGTINVMSRVQDSINRPSTGGNASGGD
jgi:hypothetical protein